MSEEHDDSPEKSLIFSLKDFKSKAPHTRKVSAKYTSQTVPEYEDTYELRKLNEQRHELYSRESFKEDKDEQSTQSSIQANNQIFSMLFSKKPPESTFVKKNVQQHLKLEDFEVGRKIGQGKFGEVFTARHRDTGFICALKKISRNNIDLKNFVQLIREIKIQSYLNYPNIVKLYTFFSDSSAIYLVLQLCCQGQLYTLLRRKKRLKEDLARNIVQQVCKALEFMHENEILHRDLKPQNIIFNNGMFKICDFGWAASSQGMRQTFCGTPLYVSPELLKRKDYNNKIDVWSIGILTYQLLFGRVPFDIVNERDFIKIVENQIKFSKGTSVSLEAKEFIEICLQKEPRDRYSVQQLLEHPFLTNVEPMKMAQLE